MTLLFFWGCLALLQMTVLPGAIVLRFVRPAVGWAERAALTLGVSLLANYLLASGLAWLGIYTRVALLALLVLEIVAWLWLARAELARPVKEALTRGLNRLQAVLTAAGQALDGQYGPAQPVLLLGTCALAVAVVAWSLARSLRSLGGVFTTWDAVLSWNRWAVTWAGGRFPTDTGYYAQLLPANWSLSYVWMGGTHVQLFAHALGLVFFPALLLLMLVRGLHERSWGALLGVAFTWALLRSLLGEYLSDGYADLPVAFLVFLALALLLDIRAGMTPPQRWALLWLSGLSAVAAALTKPAGLYLLATFPALAVALPPREEQPSVPWGREVLWTTVACLTLGGGFYLWKALAIRQGLDESNVAWVTQGIFGGAGALERLVDAWNRLGMYRWLFAWLAPAWLWARTRSRWLTALVVAPYSVIWMLFFSYDTRNLALVLPLVGLCAGWGLEDLTAWLAKGLRPARRGRLRVGGLVAVGGLALLAVSLWLGDARLEHWELARQKEIFSPQLNAKLYAYFGDAGPDRAIIAQYPVGYLPGFEGRQVSFWFDNLADFLHAQRQPEVGYALVPDNADEAILAVVEQGLAAGDYQFVFDDDSYLPARLIKIVRPRSP